VTQPLYEILRAATDHLIGKYPESRRLADLSRQVGNLKASSQHDNRLNWLAGLRTLPPFRGRLQGSSSEDEMHSRGEEVVATLEGSGNHEGAEAALAVDESSLVISGSCHAALLFSSLSPTVTVEDVRTLVSVLIGQYSRHMTAPAINDFSEPVLPNPTLPAWEQGYELAELIHSEMDIDTSEGWVDVARLLKRLGVTCPFTGVSPVQAPVGVGSQGCPARAE
jgi:hypothetical protein